MSRTRLIVPVVVAAASLTLLGLKVAETPGGQMKEFADSYLSSLEDSQRATAVMPYSAPERVGWHFIPKDTRKGIPIGEMNAAQKTAALRLVRAALSEAGYDKTTKIMQLEQVLQDLEGDGRRWARDPGLYYLTIFGNPSNDSPWGMSFEGHHLSLNFVCRDGKVVDSTPQFMGANPAIIKDEVEGKLGKGTRVLRDEEQLAFELVNSLTEGQSKVAIIAPEALGEIRFAGDAQAAVGQPEGIPYARLSGDQKSLLERLVYVYTDAVPEAVAKQRRDQIKQDGWDSVHFAWAGATEPGIGHYYRIRGKRFLIEFVNTQPDASGNPANHIHAVFRDLSGDFDLAAAQ